MQAFIDCIYTIVYKTEFCMQSTKTYETEVCTQLTKACVAKTSCNQLLVIDSATYMLIKIYSPDVMKYSGNEPLQYILLQFESEVKRHLGNDHLLLCKP